MSGHKVTVSIPIRKKAAPGPKGDDGASSFVVDLSNEMDTVPTKYSTNGGAVIADGAFQLTVPLSVFYGTIDKKSECSQITAACSALSSYVSINSAKNLYINIPNGTTLSAKRYEVTVTAVHSLYGTRTAVFSLMRGVPGEPIFNLKPDFSSVHKDKDGNYTPSSVTIKVVKSHNGTSEVLDGKTVFTNNGITLAYYNYSNSTITAIVNNAVFTANNSTYFGSEGLKVYLYRGTSVNAANLIDQETIPIMSDGKTGGTGGIGPTGPEGQSQFVYNVAPIILKTNNDGSVIYSSNNTTVLTATYKGQEVSLHNWALVTAKCRNIDTSKINYTKPNSVANNVNVSQYTIVVQSGAISVTSKTVKYTTSTGAISTKTIYTPTTDAQIVGTFDMTCGDVVDVPVEVVIPVRVDLSAKWNQFYADNDQFLSEYNHLKSDPNGEVAQLTSKINQTAERIELKVNRTTFTDNILRGTRTYVKKKTPFMIWETSGSYGSIGLYNSGLYFDELQAKYLSWHIAQANSSTVTSNISNALNNSGYLDFLKAANVSLEYDSYYTLSMYIRTAAPVSSGEVFEFRSYIFKGNTNFAQYVFRGPAKFKQDGSDDFNVVDTDKIVKTVVTKKAQWQRVCCTFKTIARPTSVSEGTKENCTLGIVRLKKGDTHNFNMGYMGVDWALEIAAVKFEKNDHPTDYHASESDELLETGIDIENKKVTVTANNFEVQNNNGDTTFTIDANGNIIGSGNAKFKGAIEADSGYFKGDITGSTGKFSGQLDVANGQFKVESNGKMTAKNADIEGKIKSSDADVTGKIVATSGTIGGATIKDNGLFGLNNIFFKAKEFEISSSKTFNVGDLEKYNAILFKNTSNSDLTVTLPNFSTTFLNNIDVQLTLGDSVCWRQTIINKEASNKAITINLPSAIVWGGDYSAALRKLNAGASMEILYVITYVSRDLTTQTMYIINKKAS